MDETLILRKIAELDGYLAQLEELSVLSEADYSQDWKTQRIVDRSLQLVIECCTDIANQIISARALPVPTSYAHAYVILGESKLLTRELADTMARVARFRNILVHQYAALDPRLVIGILHGGISDVRAYRDAVLACLN